MKMLFEEHNGDTYVRVERSEEETKEILDNIRHAAIIMDLSDLLLIKQVVDEVYNQRMGE